MKELLDKLKIQTYTASVNIIDGGQILSKVKEEEVISVKDLKRVFNAVVDEAVPNNYKQIISQYVDRKDIGGFAEWVRACFEDILLIKCS